MRTICFVAMMSVATSTSAQSLLTEVRQLRAEIDHAVANPLPQCKIEFEGKTATISGGCHESFVDSLVEVQVEAAIRKLERIVVRVPQYVRPKPKDMIARSAAYRVAKDRLWGKFQSLVIYARDEIPDSDRPYRALEMFERKYGIPTTKDEKALDVRVHRILWANIVHVSGSKTPVQIIFE